MGYVYDSKCVLLILLQILWEETDAEHIMTYEEVGEKIFEVYEPKKEISGHAAKVRFVRRYVNELHDFLSYKRLYEPKSYCPEIVMTWIVHEGVRNRGVFLENRILGYSELSLLSDAILFSKGIDMNCAKKLHSKIGHLGNRHYINSIGKVKKLGAVEHTMNEDVFHNLDIIVEAIQKSRMISFEYKDSERLFIFPFCMAGELGFYYLLGSFEDSDKIYHFRLDRMRELQIEAVVVPDERMGKNMDWDIYFRQHPRMSYGEVVRVTLLSGADIMDAIQEEFYVDTVTCCPCGKKMITISSTKTAVCNWIINVTEDVKVLDDHGSGVVDELCARAKRLLRLYEK